MRALSCRNAWKRHRFARLPRGHFVLQRRHQWCAHLLPPPHAWLGADLQETLPRSSRREDCVAVLCAGGCDPNSDCVLTGSETTACGASPAPARWLFSSTGVSPGLSCGRRLLRRLARPRPLSQEGWGASAPSPAGSLAPSFAHATARRRPLAPVAPGPCKRGFTGTGDTACVDTDGCKVNLNQPNSSSPCARNVHCFDVPAALDTSPGANAFTCGPCPAGRAGNGTVCYPCALQTRVTGTSAGAGARR